MLVYRTADKSQNEAFDAFLAQAEIRRKALEKIAFEVTGEPTVYSWRPNWFAGIGATEGGAPKGWRPQDANGLTVLVPDRRTKIGREAAERIEEIDKAARRGPAIAGVPGLVIHLNVAHEPQFFRWQHCDDARLYVVINCAHSGAEEQGTHIPDQVDTAIWEPVKLSEFYALKETEEAGDAAAKAA